MTNEPRPFDWERLLFPRPCSFYSRAKIAAARQHGRETRAAAAATTPEEMRDAQCGNKLADAGCRARVYIRGGSVRGREEARLPLRARPPPSTKGDAGLGNNAAALKGPLSRSSDRRQNELAGSVGRWSRFLETKPVPSIRPILRIPPLPLTSIRRSSRFSYRLPKELSPARCAKSTPPFYSPMSVQLACLAPASISRENKLRSLSPGHRAALLFSSRTIRRRMERRSGGGRRGEQRGVSGGSRKRAQLHPHAANSLSTAAHLPGGTIMRAFSRA